MMLIFTNRNEWWIWYVFSFCNRKKFRKIIKKKKTMIFENLEFWEES